MEIMTTHYFLPELEGSTSIRTFSFRDPRHGEEPGRNEYYDSGASEPVFPAARV